MSESIVVSKLVRRFNDTGYKCVIEDFKDEDFRNHYLSDFGFDSLDTVDFIWSLEKELNISIGDEAFNYVTVGAFVDALEKYVGE